MKSERGQLTSTIVIGVDRRYARAAIDLRISQQGNPIEDVRGTTYLVRVPVGTELEWARRYEVLVGVIAVNINTAGYQML